MGGKVGAQLTVYQLHFIQLALDISEKKEGWNYQYPLRSL